MAERTLGEMIPKELSIPSIRGSERSVCLGLDGRGSSGSICSGSNSIWFGSGSYGFGSDLIGSSYL